MQLINSAIYDKDVQARTMAKEETRKLKAQKRARVERAKVLRYAAQGAGVGVGKKPTTATADQQMSYPILVNGMPFRISHGGSKLIRISGACALLPLPFLWAQKG